MGSISWHSSIGWAINLLYGYISFDSPWSEWLCVCVCVFSAWIFLSNIITVWSAFSSSLRGIQFISFYWLLTSFLPTKERPDTSMHWNDNSIGKFENWINSMFELKNIVHAHICRWAKIRVGRLNGISSIECQWTSAKLLNINFQIKIDVLIMHRWINTWSMKWWLIIQMIITVDDKIVFFFFFCPI